MRIIHINHMPYQESKAISCINVDHVTCTFPAQTALLATKLPWQKADWSHFRGLWNKELEKSKSCVLGISYICSSQKDTLRIPKDPSRWSKQDVRLFKTAQYLPMSFHRLWSQFFVKCFGVCPRSSVIHTAEWWGKLWNKRASLCKCILFMHSS